MKVTVDFDCTPEEARRLMGLPDLTPVHEVYIENLRKTVTDGIGPEYFVDVMKNWGPMSEGAFTMWKAMFEQMGGNKT
jgi:uncharacterized protein DUF6489